MRRRKSVITGGEEKRADGGEEKVEKEGRRIDRQIDR